MFVHASVINDAKLPVIIHSGSVRTVLTMSRRAGIENKRSFMVQDEDITKAFGITETI